MRSRRQVNSSEALRKSPFCARDRGSIDGGGSAAQTVAVNEAAALFGLSGDDHPLTASQSPHDRSIGARIGGPGVGSTGHERETLVSDRQCYRRVAGAVLAQPDMKLIANASCRPVGDAGERAPISSRADRIGFGDRKAAARRGIAEGAPAAEHAEWIACPGRSAKQHRACSYDYRRRAPHYPASMASGIARWLQLFQTPSAMLPVAELH